MRVDTLPALTQGWKEPPFVEVVDLEAFGEALRDTIETCAGLWWRQVERGTPLQELPNFTFWVPLSQPVSPEVENIRVRVCLERIGDEGLRAIVQRLTRGPQLGLDQDVFATIWQRIGQGERPAVTNTMFNTYYFAL